MYTTITDIPKNMHTEKEEQTIRLILLSFLKDEKEEEKGISNGGEFQTVRAWNWPDHVVPLPAPEIWWQWDDGLSATWNK